MHSWSLIWAFAVGLSTSQMLNNIEVGSEILSTESESKTDDNDVRHKFDSGAIMVDGKEELPLSIESEARTDADPSDTSNDNDCEQKDQDDTRNANARLGRSQSCRGPSRQSATLPRSRRRRALSGSFTRSNLLPPHRVTPDGTAIYYWCELPRRPGSQGKLFPQCEKDSSKITILSR